MFRRQDSFFGVDEKVRLMNGDLELLLHNCNFLFERILWYIKNTYGRRKFTT